MTLPAAPTLEQPADDDVVEALDATFRLPSFVQVRDLELPSVTRDPEPATFAEYAAMAMFACLAVCSVVLVLVSFMD